MYGHNTHKHVTYMCLLRQSELSWCFAPSILASIVVDTPWAAKRVGISPCVGIKTLTGARLTAGECEGTSKHCVHTTTVYMQLQPLPFKVLHIQVFDQHHKCMCSNSVQDKQEAIITGNSMLMCEACTCECKHTAVEELGAPKIRCWDCPLGHYETDWSDRMKLCLRSSFFCSLTRQGTCGKTPGQDYSVQLKPTATQT